VEEFEPWLAPSLLRSAMRRARIANDMAVKTWPHDPCFCGSGKKFKHLHGGLPAAAATPQLLSSQEIGALVRSSSRTG